MNFFFFFFYDRRSLERGKNSEGTSPPEDLREKTREFDAISWKMCRPGSRETKSGEGTTDRQALLRLFSRFRNE